MAYIITSKTRKRSVNGKTVTMLRPGIDKQIRITDERGAERLHRENPGMWTEPKASPAQPKE